MLLDLLGEGVPRRAATAFYAEIRCLSRANLYVDPKTKLLNVCFRRDYSKLVGELLAKYVEPVFSELGTEVATNENVLRTSSRTADADTRRLLAEISANQKLAVSVKSSCCRTCFSSRYFVFFKNNMCVQRPTGSHCCHTVCKSLQRLKIGMTESVAYCCPDLYPQKCMV